MQAMKITKEHWVIDFPFMRRFHDSMEKGIKTCTTRSRPYGRFGYKWQCGGRTYRTLGIVSLPLGYVARNLWAQEGCDSPEHFIEVWNEIHPFKEYNPNTKKMVHFFVVLCDHQHPERPEIKCDKSGEAGHDLHQNQACAYPWNEEGIVKEDA